MYLVDAMEASLEDDAHTNCNVSKASEFILMRFDYKPKKKTRISTCIGGMKSKIVYNDLCLDLIHAL
jgi:hypothetical protein